MILIFLKYLQNQKNQLQKKKKLTLKNAIIFLDGRQKVFNAFESRLTSILHRVAMVSDRYIFKNF